jgi:Protein of unknown function (DUF4199)
MNPIISAGVLIGLLCSAWTFVMGFTGWYKDPALALSLYVPVVILFEIGGLVWGLRRTEGQGHAYTGQILAGTMMAIVAGVVIVASSLLFTTVVFPSHVTEFEQTTRATLQRQGVSDADIAKTMPSSAAGQTPMGQAMRGFLGTLITGIVASAIIGLFVRSRPDRIRARPHMSS